MSLGASDSVGNKSPISLKLDVGSAVIMRDLVKKRGAIKGRLTVFVRFVSSFQNAILTDKQITELQLRKSACKSLLEEFNTIQSSIEEHVEDSDLTQQLETREQFENLYYQTLTEVEHLIRNSCQQTGHKSRCNEPSTLVKLPVITLPSFDGEVANWLEFRNVYTSMIHNSEQLDNVQKFHYLRSALTGNAAEIIKSIQLTAENYNIAWELIEGRYNNNNLLIHNHVKTLFALQPVTKESASQIRRLLDTVLKSLRALESLGEKVDSWDTMVIYLVISRLDPFTQKEWEQSKILNQSHIKPRLSDLIAFLRSKADMLDMVKASTSSSSKYNHDKIRKQHQNMHSLVAVRNHKQARNKHVCLMCKDSHLLYSCSKFLDLSVKDRREFVDKFKLCSNCLRAGHNSVKCLYGSCKRCKQKHNSLLHTDARDYRIPIQQSELDIRQSTQTTTSNLVNTQNPEIVLLSTALIDVLGSNNEYYRVKALIDNGSQHCFITESLCNKLQGKSIHSKYSITGVGKTIMQSTRSCHVNFKAISSNYTASVMCIVLQRITSTLPLVRIDLKQINVPDNIALADPLFCEPSEIDVLLGADQFWDLLLDGRIKLPSGPYLQNTKLGWVVSGSILSGRFSNVETTQCYLARDSLLDENLQKFWELEEVKPPSTPIFSKEEQECETLFLKTTTRNSDGRFSVHIPLRESECELGESYSIAKRRLLALERRLASSHEQNRLYLDFMRDYLYFTSAVDKNVTDLTKRKVLSLISQIYDPLGLLTPIVVRAKIFMQKLWLYKLGWDEQLPPELVKAWINIVNSLANLHLLKIPRCVFSEITNNLELHIFADASLHMYGAVMYTRLYTQTRSQTQMLCSKNKLSPLKSITIPRSELLAVLLAARLFNKVNSALNIQFDHVFIWTDSTIVLGWLRTPPNQLKTFVQNRVVEILDRTASVMFKYVRSEENPADILTRGISVDKLCNSKLWWQGPEFLCKLQPINSTQPDIEIDLPELKSNVNSICCCVTSKSLQQTQYSFPFEKFSSFRRMVNVCAYMLRFIHNCREQFNQNRYSNGLSVLEIKQATHCLAKILQAQCFNNEYHILVSHSTKKLSRRISGLNIFLDEDNLIRVGGRLVNSRDFSYEKKHPILICSKHPFTKLLFRREHVKLLHAGPQLILANIRNSWWPLGGRNLARNTVLQCLRCTRISGRTPQPIMSNLPEDRLIPTGVFNIVGVDYLGPLHMLNKRGRGARLEKCYVCLFVCFATRALHLELVTSLSTDSYILALKRFISRRGKPFRIYSDNGRNFVSAAKELAKFLQSHSTTIKDYASDNHIDFKFIPPYAPHFGGLWESGVRAMKYHFTRIVGNAHLTNEELTTVLAQIEAVLNSRPMSPMSTDPNDLAPLTPGHFLVGRPLTAPACEDLSTKAVHTLTRYQRVEQLRQHFWSRWSKEYISELQNRTKWKENREDLKENTLVVIKDDHLPPMQWRLGRVITVHPGRDGKSRVATIRTSTGIIQRAYPKICPLVHLEAAKQYQQQKTDGST